MPHFPHRMWQSAAAEAVLKLGEGFGIVIACRTRGCCEMPGRPASECIRRWRSPCAQHEMQKGNSIGHSLAWGAQNAVPMAARLEKERWKSSRVCIYACWWDVDVASGGLPSAEYWKKGAHRASAAVMPGLRGAQPGLDANVPDAQDVQGAVILLKDAQGAEAGLPSGVPAPRRRPFAPDSSSHIARHQASAGLLLFRHQDLGCSTTFPGSPLQIHWGSVYSADNHLAPSCLKWPGPEAH